MRILLDECVDEDLRHYLAPHDCESCRYAGFKGLTNGQLLAAAENAGFQVLITVDQNIPNQQNLRRSSIALLLLRSRTTNLEDLVPLVPDMLAALERSPPGEIVVIGSR